MNSVHVLNNGSSIFGGKIEEKHDSGSSGMCCTCRKNFRTERGLKTHQTRSHKEEEPSTSRSAPATLNTRTPLRSAAASKIAIRKHRRRTTAAGATACTSATSSSSSSPRTSLAASFARAGLAPTPLSSKQLNGIRTSAALPRVSASSQARKANPSSAGRSNAGEALSGTASHPRTPEQKSASFRKIREDSRVAVDRRFSAACQTVGFANIFSLEEVKKIKEHIDTYRLKMICHSAFKSKWASVAEERQTETIESDIKRAFTHFMNKEIVGRRGCWDRQLKRWAPTNYSIVTDAAANLRISVSHDAKSLIYFIDKERDAEKDARELAQEPWSEESGRSVKTTMIKIRHPEQPEFYISKRVLQEGMSRREWAPWEKLIEEMGKSYLDVPIVIKPFEMDQFVLYLMRSRELSMNYVVGYEAILFEPEVSERVRSRIGDALRTVVNV